LPGDDDVIRRARIREVAQAVFPASRVGAALAWLYKATVQRQQFSSELSLARVSVSVSPAASVGR
jgi:hypothetical protein